MPRAMWQVLFAVRGAFHQLKLLNGLSSAGAALNGIIVGFDGDEKCTFAKRSHAQVICLQSAYKDTCEKLQRSPARLVH